jgi:hypothetical protein
MDEIQSRAGIFEVNLSLQRARLKEMTVLPFDLIIKDSLSEYCKIVSAVLNIRRKDRKEQDMEWLSEQHNNNNARIAGNNACSNFNNNNVNNNNRFRAVFRP